MASDSFDFKEVTRVTAGAIGEPAIVECGCIE